MVRSPERIDFGTASAALTALERELQGGQSASLDLATLTTFDSAALAVLLALRRRFGGADGSRFDVRNPPAALRALAEVYGIAGLLFEPQAAGADVAALPASS